MNEPRRCLLLPTLPTSPFSGRLVAGYRAGPSPSITQADLPDGNVVTQAPTRNLCARKQFGGEVETAGSHGWHVGQSNNIGDLGRDARAPTTKRQRKHGAVQCHALTLLDRRDQLLTELLGGVGTPVGVVDDLAVMIYLVGVTIPRYSLQQAFESGCTAVRRFRPQPRAEKFTLTACPKPTC